MLNFCLFSVSNDRDKLFICGKGWKLGLTGEAIYITKNGILDLVVMDADAFQQREHLLKLTNIVLEGKADKKQDMTACSPEEMEAMLKKLKKALEQEKVKVK